MLAVCFARTLYLRYISASFFLTFAYYLSLLVARSAVTRNVGRIKPLWHPGSVDVSRISVAHAIAQAHLTISDRSVDASLR